MNFDTYLFCKGRSDKNINSSHKEQYFTLKRLHVYSHSYHGHVSGEGKGNNTQPGVERL